MVFNISPPLRNDQYPNGLPWLTTEQQERVNKANELYQVTCELITLCQQHKILWSCENPGRSLMWQTTSFVSLFHTIHCESTQLHHCMYGSSRRKLTRLIHNIPSFRQLCQICDNGHEHGPWGQKPDGSWATSEETAYPWPLARAIAAQVVFAITRTRTLCAISPVLPNRNVPCRLCGLLPTFSHVNTCHQWCLNSNKSFIDTLRLVACAC